MRRFVHLWLGLAVACAAGDAPKGSATSPPPNTSTPSNTTVHSYATNFSATEFPISEGGRWVNGGTLAIDWTDVSTTPGHAIGHQVGSSYTDATALLTGTWGADQSATAVVFTTGPIQDECLSEVEIRLRSSMSPHDNHGYEITFKVSQTEEAYLLIVRWDGPLGKFTSLLHPAGAKYGVTNGDVMKATIVGNRITAYKNGVMMGSVTDDTFTSGNPGIGFNLESPPPGCRDTNDRYGFTAFSATDSISP
jgi:hypothetical protein